MRTTLVYSSLTGNTEKVAKAIKENVQGIEGLQKIETLSADIQDYDAYIVCYWNARGTADPKTLKFLASITNKKIIAIGTLGAYPTGEHAMRMKARVKEVIESHHNTLIADFCCQGRIDPARTEKRRLIPKGEKHHLDEEGYKRHLESRLHPNELDFENAIAVVKQGMKQLNES